jgi:hypothetical protein
MRSSWLLILSCTGCAQILGIGDFGNDGGGGTTTTSSDGGAGATTSSSSSPGGNSVGAGGPGGSGAGGNEGGGGGGPTPGELIWASNHGAATNETLQNIAVSPSGDIYVIGKAEGSFSFAGKPVTLSGSGFYLAKIDSNGNGLWAKGFSFDLSFGEHLYGVAASDTEVVIGGMTGSAIDLGGGPLNGAFVGSFDITGALKWSKSCGGDNSLNYKAQTGAAGGIALDAASNVYLLAMTNGTVKCGASAGVGGTVLNKFNKDGVFQWQKSNGSGGYDYRSKLAVDSGGNLILTGDSSSNWGGGSLPREWIAKLAPNSAHIWSRPVTVSGLGIQAASLAVGPQDEIFVGGNFSSTIDLGMGPISPSGTRDAFLVRFSASGMPMTSNHWGNGNASLDGLAIEPGTGAVFVSGTFSGSLSFGGPSLSAPSSQDAFFAKLNPQFNHIYSLGLVGDADDESSALAISPQTMRVILGGVTGSPSLAIGTKILTSNGGNDVFLAAFRP